MSDIAGIDGLGQETKRKPPLTQHRSVSIGNSSYELPSNKVGAITREEVAILDQIALGTITGADRPLDVYACAYETLLARREFLHNLHIV